MKIKDITDITPGLVITRKKATNKYDIENIYKVLTLNAIDRHGNIDIDELTIFESIEELNDHYFTKQGDVLIRLNEPFTSIYIDSKYEGILIPSYFAKLKVIDGNFTPEYLSWYLNSNKVKREFLRHQSGTLVPSINQRIIKELDIPKKSLKEQEYISNLYKLYIKEIYLLDRLIKEREKQFKAITEKLLKN